MALNRQLKRGLVGSGQNTAKAIKANSTVSISVLVLLFLVYFASTASARPSVDALLHDSFFHSLAGKRVSAPSINNRSRVVGLLHGVPGSDAHDHVQEELETRDEHGQLVSHMRYHVTPHQNMFSFDEAQEIDSIVCSKDRSVLTLSTSTGHPFSAALVQSLRDGVARGVREGRPFVGVGHQNWGCAAEPHTRMLGNTSIMVQILEVLAVSLHSGIVKLRTIPASWHHVFEHASISFHSRHLPHGRVPAESLRQAHERLSANQQQPSTHRLKSGEGITTSSSWSFGSFIDSVCSLAWHYIQDTVDKVIESVKVITALAELGLTGDLSVSPTDQQIVGFGVNYNIDKKLANGNLPMDSGIDGVTGSCSNCYAYAGLTLHFEITISNYSLVSAQLYVLGSLELNVEGSFDFQQQYVATFKGQPQTPYVSPSMSLSLAGLSFTVQVTVP